MGARRISVRVSNPAKKKKPCHGCSKARRRRRRNPEQLTFAQVAAKHAPRAKSLRGRPGSKRGRFISKIAKKKGKRYAPARKRAPAAAAPRRAARFEQLTLEEAMRGVPKVNRRGKGNAAIVILPGSSTSSGSSSSSSSSRKRKKRKAATKTAARRKGGSMAKKRKAAKRSRPRRRRCHIVKGYTNKRGKVIPTHARNPGIPMPVAVGGGIVVGALAGVAASYGADRLGLGSPTHRNWGLVLGGVIGGAILHKFSPLAGVTVGTGIAGIGAARALATTLYAPSASTPPVSGMMDGSGDGSMDGAYDQLGQGSVYDRIGQVVEDVGYVVTD